MNVRTKIFFLSLLMSHAAQLQSVQFAGPYVNPYNGQATNVQKLVTEKNLLLRRIEGLRENLKNQGLSQSERAKKLQEVSQFTNKKNMIENQLKALSGVPAARLK